MPKAGTAPQYVIATVNAVGRGFYWHRIREGESTYALLDEDPLRAKIWHSKPHAIRELERIRDSTQSCKLRSRSVQAELAVFEVRIRYELGRVTG